MILNPANELVIRIVDDYLVICSDAERLFKIKEILKTRLFLNENKTHIILWAPTQTPRIQVDDDDDFVDLLKTSPTKLFPWCGFDIDVTTLDIYFNYEKYFVCQTSLYNRLNKTNDYRNPFITFNCKFLRLFSGNLVDLVIDARLNSLSAILRNAVDIFALSVIRFMIMWKQMPEQLRNNVKLQKKLIINLCYFFNNKIKNKNIDNMLGKYFYSNFSLLKFFCFRTYCLLFVHFSRSFPQHNRLLNLLNANLKKFNFERCIKVKNSVIFSNQLIQLIEQQTNKFYNCKL